MIDAYRASSPPEPVMMPVTGFPFAAKFTCCPRDTSIGAFIITRAAGSYHFGRGLIVKVNARIACDLFGFKKRYQFFIRANNIAFAIVAMSINNEDPSNGRGSSDDTSPTSDGSPLALWSEVVDFN